MTENGVKTMKDFAAEIGVDRRAIGIVVTNYGLPIEPMTHGRAKGLSPKTQRTVKRILGIKASRAVASAN
jgi:hypothetical protein